MIHVFRLQQKDRLVSSLQTRQDNNIIQVGLQYLLPSFEDTCSIHYKAGEMGTTERQTKYGQN